MTTIPPQLPDPREFARTVLAELHCHLQSTATLARDFLAGVWADLPPVAKLRMMAAGLRGMSERVDELARRIEDAASRTEVKP